MSWRALAFPCTQLVCSASMVITLTLCTVGGSVMHTKEVHARLIRSKVEADVFLVEVEINGSVKR